MPSAHIEARGSIAVVRLQSNRVNKMNPAFFDDVHEAFDRLDRDHPRAPVVLTAEGSTFSAGLDFEDVFPRFARGDAAEITAWFERFRATLLRVFESPRRTVAAINGHAFAGGLILALCCDHRLAARGPAKFAINEVPVGIPMPSTYLEMMRYAVGARVTCEATFTGRVYAVEQAHLAGFIHEIVEPEHLLEAAVREAGRHGEDCFDAYAASKKALLAPVLDYIERVSKELDHEALRTLALPSSTRAQAAALARLKQPRG
jgi:enoyl-CoA hydratase/carnithine racemase